MPQLSFITPVALVALALVPLMWAFALLTPRRAAPLRFWGGLLLRTLILVALVLALAGAQLVQPVRTLTTVFLLDASDSIAPAQRERAIQYVDRALAGLPPGDRAAVVAFGAGALVERAPASLAALGRINSVPVTTRTNIQEAIQLGVALLPADSQKRLVLLSDGGENSGRAADAARLALARGVPLDVVILPSEHGADVILTGVEAPSEAREEQELAISVRLNANYATSGRLQIFVDGQLAQELDVTIPAGSSTVSARLPAGTAGFRRIEARLEAQGDTEPQNNRTGSFVEVTGPPRVLIIASEAGRAANLRAALQSAGVRVDVLPPAQAPASLDQLNTYASVVLLDTPSRDVPRALLQALPGYVRDLGRGFAMIGGTDSFGAGGYRRTPADATGANIESMLPVSLDPLDTAQQPDLGLVMVIDRSGSMSEPAGGQRTKLDLAKEAVYQATLGLSQRDQVGLVVFDDQAETILPLQKLPSAIDIEQALGRFNDGGGTDILPGLQAAAQAITAANTKIKHIILMTDGLAPSNYSQLVTQLHDAGVTISTVAIGSDADANLENIAKQGGGRYYRVEDVSQIPAIFLQETVIVAGRDIIEGQIAPAVALQAPVVRDVGGLPALYGYNGTELKQSARAIIVTPDNKPLLAQWQYGLGRAVAWTSDFKGQWGRDWVSWNQFPLFVGGLADMLLPPPDAGTLTLRASSSGGQTALELSAQDEQGRTLNQLALSGTLVAPDNAGAPLKFSQIAPGRYRAVAPADTPGVYLAQVAALGADGQPVGTAATGLVVSYSPEYSETRDNPQLLRDLAGITGGRVDPAPETIFDSPAQRVGTVTEIGLPLVWLALMLWPLDIALRRLFPRLGDFAPALARLRRRRPAEEVAGAGASMARLSAAKQRARDLRAVPEIQARPAEPLAAAPPTAAPATTQASATPQAAAPLEAAPAAPTSDDDQLARLLAAKQRARKQRQ
jgi:Mg-chelatase subunit ChlD